MNRIYRIVARTFTGGTLAVSASTVMAHSGHSHADLSLLASLLHSLSTHPIVLISIVLAILVSLRLLRD